jgi:hypothetical protein
MGGPCTTHGRNEKFIQYFGWQTWREETTGKKWEDIGMDLREIGCGKLWIGYIWRRIETIEGLL